MERFSCNLVIAKHFQLPNDALSFAEDKYPREVMMSRNVYCSKGGVKVAVGNCPMNEFIENKSEFKKIILQ